MKRPALLLFLLLNSVTSYKILVYNSKFGHSNINFYGSIADILVDAGHDVTTLLPDIDPSWGDGTLKSKKIHIKQTPESKQHTDILNSAAVPWFGMNNYDFIGTFFFGTPYADRFVLQCKGTVEETALIEKLRDEKFDVMITENFDMCGIGLVPLIKPKSLINGAAAIPIAWMNQEFGIQNAWSYNPSPINSNLNVHSFWSRLNNLYAEAIFYRLFYSSRSLIENLFKQKFGPEYPGLPEISSHAAYTIVNSEPLVDYAVPTLSRVIYVGGLGARPPQNLSKEFNGILSIRPRTVLLSFGSIVIAHEMPQEVKNNIVESISKFPDVTFIWKYEKPEDDFAKNVRTKVPNLHLLKWVPQNDLLADDRLVAFITHGGMGSTQETTVRGKPGLFIPCFGDQPRNAAMMEKSGLGKVFDKLDLLYSEKFTTAIADLLENQRYHENAKRIASMIAKKPFSAREQLIRTVEFAAEFGPSPALRPQSYDMSFIAYHNLDIIFMFCAVALIVLYAINRAIRLVCKMCTFQKSKVE